VVAAAAAAAAAAPGSRSACSQTACVGIQDGGEKGGTAKCTNRFLPHTCTPGVRAQGRSPAAARLHDISNQPIQCADAIMQQDQYLTPSWLHQALVACQQRPELALSCQVLQQLPFLGCFHPASGRCCSLAASLGSASSQ
jgi:hypothetical protein